MANDDGIGGVLSLSPNEDGTVRLEYTFPKPIGGFTGITCPNATIVHPCAKDEHIVPHPDAGIGENEAD